MRGTFVPVRSARGIAADRSRCIACARGSLACDAYEGGDLPGRETMRGPRLPVRATERSRASRHGAWGGVIRRAAPPLARDATAQTLATATAAGQTQSQCQTLHPAA